MYAANATNVRYRCVRIVDARVCVRCTYKLYLGDTHNATINHHHHRNSQVMGGLPDVTNATQTLSIQQNNTPIKIYTTNTKTRNSLFAVKLCDEDSKLNHENFFNDTTFIAIRFV